MTGHYVCDKSGLQLAHDDINILSGAHNQITGGKDKNKLTSIPIREEIIGEVHLQYLIKRMELESRARGRDKTFSTPYSLKQLNLPPTRSSSKPSCISILGVDRVTN